MFNFIEDASVKQAIAREVLLDLPEWFGLPESTQAYIDQVKDMVFISIGQEECMGFCALDTSNALQVNLHVLGLKKIYHNQGIGGELIKFITAYGRENGYGYLSVLTLSGQHESIEYGLTRKFYLKTGFKEFIDLPSLWDPCNPAVLMVKVIDQ